MEKGIVVYSSVTVVHRAKKLLKKRRLEARVVQLPSDLGLQGCSYGLECAPEALDSVLAYSAEQQLRVRAVYRTRETAEGRVYTPYDLS